MKRGKRYRALLEKVDRTKLYELREAIETLKGLQSAKFVETVELSVKLGVDPRRYSVRGSVVLPYGTGKEKKVLVLTESKVKDAQEAGADYVGGDEYISKIEKGWLEFDYVIATPDIMRKVAKLGKILGPRGLMPSPKTGTVTDNVKEAVSQAKKGKIDFKIDKTGCIHGPVGKVNFPTEHLCENVKEFMRAILDAKPGDFKGTYIQSVHLSTTMSPSVKLDLLKLMKEVHSAS